MIVQEEGLFERCSAIFLLGGLKKLSATLLEIDVLEELSGRALSIKEVEISRAPCGVGHHWNHERVMVSRFVSSRHETLGVWPMISRGAVNTIHLESLLIVQNLNTYCQVSGGFSYTFVISPTGASRASREVKRPVVNNASLCCLCGKSLVAMLTLYKSPLFCFRACLIVLQHCSHRTIVILDKGFLIMSFSSPLYVRVTRFSIFPFSPLV